LIRTSTAGGEARYTPVIENRCPEEHDDVRWVSLDVATELDLADAEYIPLLQRALRA
jgi:hypothetical protein